MWGDDVIIDPKVIEEIKRESVSMDELNELEKKYEDVSIVSVRERIGQAKFLELLGAGYKVISKRGTLYILGREE